MLDYNDNSIQNKVNFDENFVFENGLIADDSNQVQKPKNCKAVAYGNGVFVTFSSKDGYVYNSKDGIKWEIVNNKFYRSSNKCDIKYYINKVLFTNNLFLAIGTKEKITYWSKGTIRKISKSGVILISCNGESWTEIKDKKILLSKNWKCASSTGKEIVVLGSNGKTLFPKVMNYAIGIKDFSKCQALYDIGEVWEDMAYGETYEDGEGWYVAISRDGKIAYSPSGACYGGACWDVENLCGRNQRLIDFNLSLLKIVYGNGRFIILGDHFIACLAEQNHKTAQGNKFFLVNFTEIKLTSTVRDNICVNDICFADNKFIIVGDGVVFLSEDGLNWVEGKIDNKRWVSICHGDNKFLAISDNGETALLNN